MIDTGKYRQYSIAALVVLVAASLLSFISLWNSMLTADVRHEGWVILSLLLLLISGILLFVIAYRSTDVKTLDREMKSAFESGKALMLKEIEKRNAEESNDQKIEEENLDKTVENILSGIQATRSQAGFCNKVLSNISKHMGFVQGILYLKDPKDQIYNPAGEYALTGQKPRSFSIGENLTGEVAETRQIMIIYDVPEDYFSISSGLGDSKPKFLLLVPVVNDKETIAVIELAAFKKPDEVTRKLLIRVSDQLGLKLNKFIAA